ncbi:calcium-binding protein [Rhizobium sp.]
MADIRLGSESNTYLSTTPGDRIFGEGGGDTITASDGGNTIYGGAGDDTLKGGDGNDVLYGDDTIDNTAHNILLGGGGNDEIYSYSAFDEIDAGDGDDIVRLNSIIESPALSSAAVEGGTGTDTLVLAALAGSGDAISFGVARQFTVFVNELGSVVATDFERIVLRGGYGAINVAGGDLADTIEVNASRQAYFSAGNLSGGGGDDTFIVYGTSNNNRERIDGGDGMDTLGWQEVAGGDVFNSLKADATKGTLIGDGTVLIDFTSIEALNINATMTTGAIDFKGGKGDDTLVAWKASSSKVDTGKGNDYVSIATGTAEIDLGDGNDTAGVDFSNASRVNIDGGAGNDEIRGGSGAGTLRGGAGNDKVGANSHRTSVYGDAGNDTLFRNALDMDDGKTKAVIDGGAGRDTLVLSVLYTSHATKLDLSKSSFKLSDGTVVKNCEAVEFIGSASAVNKITSSDDSGGAAVNKVTGGNVNDILTASARGASLDGGFGNDRLVGGKGADILNGGFNGNDTLIGGGGNDQIIGGAGIDLLTGGAGKDTFVFAVAFHSGTTAGAVDIITDFTRAQKDRIDLSGIDAVSATTEDDAFSFIGATAFSHNAGELRFEKFDNPGKNNDFTSISGDTNGDGLADFVIQARGLIDFAETDFMR